MQDKLRSPENVNYHVAMSEGFIGEVQLRLASGRRVAASVLV